MKKWISAILVFCLLLCFGSASSLAAQETLQVDSYFENGSIYTVDASDTVAQALAVKDGKIVFVGSEQEGERYKASAKEVVDLAGGMLLPGMIDGHIHIVSPSFFDFTLINVVDVEETLSIIADYVKAHPEMEAYSGFGYMTSIFEGEEAVKGPRKERLDAISPDKPLSIASFDGHAIWMNSAAFERNGITTDTIMPPGGEMPMDEETGEIWGTLKDSALSLAVRTDLPAEKLSEALIAYQAGLNAMGYTGIVALAGNGFSPLPWEGLKQLENEGLLTLRVHGGSVVTSWKTEENLKTLAQEKEKYNNGLVKLIGAKFFADGVLDNGSALLLEPYSNNEQNHGEAGWSQEALNEAVTSVNALGLLAHTHAIGDGGVHMALNAAEYASEKLPSGDYRNAITHLQLISPSDLKRFAQLNVIAVAQPYWHFKQPDYFEPIEKGSLGERAEQEYPLKSLLDSGVTLTFASDYPVTLTPNPFVAIEIAVTRNLPDGKDYQVEDITHMDDPAYLLNASERISVLEAIRAFTATGAYAMLAEDSTGTLEVGKSADMIIINQDLLTCDPLAISDTAVLRTYFQGKLVYQAQ